MKTRKTVSRRTVSVLLLAAGFALIAAAAGNGDVPGGSGPVDAGGVSLAHLAQQADLVALAQSRDTDYFYRRAYPVSGSAYLKVLIPYKLDKSVDIVEIYEQGLHPNECYFPPTTVFEEGRRYLLFVQHDPADNGRYRGLEQGCAIEVLVDENNRYAVRYPLKGIEVTDDLLSLARPMKFNDAYALVAIQDLQSIERDALLAAGHIAPHDGNFIYTHGIELGEIRRLMGEDNLTQDRHLKRPPREDQKEPG